VTIPYPHLPPELFRAGPFAIRWCGVMYLVGYLVGHRSPGRGSRAGRSMTERDLDALLV
jgi:phosphatidylglycerol:prolipoprotein diacylglycerol transferase